jgi:hypothetical protein
LGKDQKTKEIVFIIKKALIIISVTVNVLVVFAGLGAWSIKDQRWPRLFEQSNPFHKWMPALGLSCHG